MSSDCVCPTDYLVKILPATVLAVLFLISEIGPLIMKKYGWNTTGIGNFIYLLLTSLQTYLQQNPSVVASSSKAATKASTKASTNSTDPLLKPVQSLPV